MPQLPFDIPESLASYANHFEDDSIQAIKRLRRQLKKRGPDAVGHFLLAWFYHLKGMDDQAVEEALKARIYAPGSPFFQKLHYYLSHPKAFDAWTPNTSVTNSTKPPKTANSPGPVLNLDSLIQKLSAVESERIRPKEKQTEENKPTPTVATEDVDDIVSETLAKIHENQGKTEAAIRTYERLKKLNKDKTDHYNEQIGRLQTLKAMEENNDQQI